MQDYYFDYDFKGTKIPVHVNYERTGYKDAGLNLKIDFVFDTKKSRLKDIVLHWVPEELAQEEILRRIRDAAGKNLALYLTGSLNYENEKRIERAMRMSKKERRGSWNDKRRGFS